MSLYNQLSQSLPVPNDTWTKTDILLYKQILTLIDGATAAKQDTGNTSLAAILAKLIIAPATEAKQDAGNASLAAILAKLILAPATEAKQDTGNTSLATIAGKDFATQATLLALYNLQYPVKGNELRGRTNPITTTAFGNVVIAAQALNYTYITSILVTNSHATVGTVVNIVDTYDDSVMWSGYAAPAGGGYAITFPVPLKSTTVDYAIEARCLTTGASVIVSGAGFKATT